MAPAFPAVTTVRVKDAIEAVGSVVDNLVLGDPRRRSLITLIAAVLVLAGALGGEPPQPGLRRRHPEDARRHPRPADCRLRASNIPCSGWPPGCSACWPGSVAAWLVVTRIMNLSFVWLPLPALAAAAAALAVTVVFGLAGTFTALGHKPASVLRNL